MTEIKIKLNKKYILKKPNKNAKSTKLQKI